MSSQVSHFSQFDAIPPCFSFSPKGIMTPLIYFLLLVGSAQSQVTVNRLKPSGILFEPVSPAFLYQSYWNIFTKISLIDEEDTLDLVVSCEDSVDKLCNIQPQDNDFCKHWHRAIRNVIEKIRGQLGSINFFLSGGRNKRELFDGIGKLSKYLFGTMDSKDAEEIYERLQRLETHEQESMHLANKQITIMKANLETINKGFKNISDFQDQITEKMNGFSQRINEKFNQTNWELKAVRIQADLNELFIYILTTLQTVHNHINEYFTIINSLQQHRLHPLIFSPNVLVQTYLDITKGAHPFLVDIHLLNQIIEVRYAPLLTEKSMLIRIRLPLIQKEKFTLTKFHLLPLRVSSHSAIFDIEASLVLNSTETKHLMRLTSEEFREQCSECTSKTYSTVYICSQRQPKHLGIQKHDCLSDLVYSNFLNPESCKLRILEKELEFLVKLVRQNSWLFNFQAPRSLLMHCDTATLHQEINGTGVLTLDKPCQYTLETVQIPYENNHDITIPFQQPEPEIIEPPQILKKLIKYQEHDPKMGSPTTSGPLIRPNHLHHHEILKANSKPLAELESEFKEMVKKRENEVHNQQTHLNSGGLIFVYIIVFLVALIVLRKKCRRAPTNSNVAKTATSIPLKTTITNPENQKPRDSSNNLKLKSDTIQEVSTPSTSTIQSPPPLPQNPPTISHPSSSPPPPPLPQFSRKETVELPTASSIGDFRRSKERIQKSFRVRI